MPAPTTATLLLFTPICLSFPLHSGSFSHLPYLRLAFLPSSWFFFIQFKMFSSTSALYLSLCYLSSLICSLIFDSIHLLFSFHEDVKKLFSNISCFKTCLLFKVYFLSFFLISQLFPSPPLPPHSFYFCICSMRISSVCHFCEWVQFSRTRQKKIFRMNANIWKWIRKREFS